RDGRVDRGRRNSDRRAARQHHGRRGRLRVGTAAGAPGGDGRGASGAARPSYGGAVLEGFWGGREGGSHFGRPMTGWEAHRAALGARLKPDEYVVVTQSVNELQRLAPQMEIARERQTTQPFIGTNTDPENWRQMRRNATDAYNTLARLANQEKV